MLWDIADGGSSYADQFLAQGFQGASGDSIIGTLALLESEVAKCNQKVFQELRESMGDRTSQSAHDLGAASEMSADTTAAFNVVQEQVVQQNQRQQTPEAAQENFSDAQS